MVTMTAPPAWRAISPVSSVTVCSPYWKLLRNTVTGYPLVFYGLCSCGRSRSAAQAEALDERLVAFLVGLLEVIQQLAALVHHLEQPTTGVMILLVTFEVATQTVDTGGEQRDLHIGGTGV